MEAMFLPVKGTGVTWTCVVESSDHRLRRGYSPDQSLVSDSPSCTLCCSLCDTLHPLQAHRCWSAWIWTTP